MRGHKAALSNPNVSEEAKEHSRQVLAELEAKAAMKEQKRAVRRKSMSQEEGKGREQVEHVEQPTVGGQEESH
ncbi:hypothetical protein JAAARDRAFT_29843 [Jaapia argillacea MUCL 33604]|uniref:Uncharacterized protein n=1 Tax=Jaapia argillacea MUCL 33604 TaxID=933084 RepID=A0A067QJU0_9AGAM|nr:hypothetical protein JAAARDRAFT_29843 [Jaapia argillacea MUCL 33604]